jgi:hypothetical protein
MQPKWEVADVLNRLGDGVEQLGLNTWQLRTLSAIKRCRTAALGGHIDACDACGVIKVSYNSCRNRHCPKCQGHKREEWMQARSDELLPVPYFHVVFTLPSSLNALAMHQPRKVYDMLFKAAWQTLHAFGKNRGLHMGMIAILHTWGQNMSLHPHVHCIVPGGGVTKSGYWKNVRADGKFLFPVKALSKVYRAKYVAMMRERSVGEKALIQSLFDSPWVVYAKRPFGGPEAVVEYLGRYTHKIAISNHRLKDVSDGGVSFSYKDYRQGAKTKIMQLALPDFTKRFALHILPKRFVRIRHYGFLSSTWKRLKFKDLQASLPVHKTKASEVESAKQHRRCTCCKEGSMHTILVFDVRGPPSSYMRLLKKDPITKK